MVKMERSMANNLVGGQQEKGPVKVECAISQTCIRPTARRWVILVLFCLSTGYKAFQWMQVPAVTTQAALFYQVDNYVINFSSTIFMMTFLVLSWPVCFVIDKIGMRNSLLVSLFGSSLGATIKYLSYHNSSVTLLLLGDVVMSISAQLIYPMPSRLVSIWFPDHQVSLALSICILGCELGMASGFIGPGWLMSEANTRDEIGIGFHSMFLWTAVVSCTLFVLNYMAFDEAPPHPPGEARAKQIELEQQNKLVKNGNHANTSVASNVMVLLRQILKLLGNKDLVLVAFIYGIGIGRSEAILTLMDQTMRPLYPGNVAIIGLTGSLIIFSGALCLPIWGKILDKSHAYKNVTIILSIGTSLALLCLSYSAIYLKSAPLVYLAAILFGTFQSGFQVTTLELATELTYPAPELITYNLLNLMPSLFGPACILIGSYIVNTFGPAATNIFHLLTVAFGLVCILCTNERLRRQAAIQAGK